MLKKLNSDDLNKAQAVPAVEGLPEPVVRGATLEENDNDWFFEIADTFADDVLDLMVPKYVQDALKWHVDKEREESFKKVKERLKLTRIHPVNSFTIIKNRKATTYAAAPGFPIFLVDEERHKTIFQPFHPDENNQCIRDSRVGKHFIHGIDQVKKEMVKREEKLLEEQDDWESDEDDKKKKKKADKIDEVLLFRDFADAFASVAMGYWTCFYNDPSQIISDYDFRELEKCAEKVFQVISNTDTDKKISHETSVERLDLYNAELPAMYRPDPEQEGLPIVTWFDYFTFHKAYDFKQLLIRSLPYRFWEKEADFEGPRGQRSFAGWKYVFDNVQAYNFLNKMGFYRLPVEDRKTDYIFVRQNKNVVSEVKPNNVKNFIHEFVEEKWLDKALRNVLYKTAQLSEGSLSNLKQVDIDFNYFDKDRQFMFFKNGAWEVTATEIKAYKPGEIKRFVWEHDVIPHNVKVVKPAFQIFQTEPGKYDIKVNHQDCMFFNYLIQTSRMYWRKELEEGTAGMSQEAREKYLAENKFKIDGELLSPEEIAEQKQHLINKIYALGYLMHRYKDRAKPWAVVAMDNNIALDGRSYGGSGKSVCFNQALPEVLRNMHHIPGTNPDKTKDPHIFHGLTKFHQATIIDDADKNLNFRFFFEFTSGDQVVNPKQTSPYTIPFKDLGKLIWLTNFSFFLDASTKRRMINAVFSDYYHEKTEEDDFKETRTVKDDFGKSLITEFDEAEYNHFMNTMASCLQFALACPIKFEPPMNNVNKRNLLRSMGQNFFDWASIYFAPSSGNLDRLVIKDEAFQIYMAEYNVKGYTATQFKKALQNFCLFNEYIFCPEELITEKDKDKKGRIMCWVPHRKLDKGGNWPDTYSKASKECIYIQTDADLPLNRVLPGDEAVPF